MAFSTIQGSGANDATTFVGTSGVDSIVFGESIGNFFVGAQGDTDGVTFSPSQNTSNFLIVSAGTVRLGDGDDVFIAADTIFTNVLINGNADNDVLFFENSGNPGAVTSLEGSSVYGGDGDDLIDISESSIAGSRINGNKGDDELILEDVNVIRSSIFGGQGDDVIDIDFSAGDESIITRSVINGDIGNDVINVNAQLIDTVINGGADDDVITVVASDGSEGSSVFGGAGDDTIDVTGDEFIIQGNDGDDTIDVTGDDNIIQGNDGDDTIDVTGDDNIIQGNDGDDVIVVDGGDNTITGGSGVDEIDMTDGNNTIIQTTGAAATAFDDLDIIFGNGVDLITGADDNTVFAFAGALTDDTFVDDATSGLNFYVGDFFVATATTIAFFTVASGGADLLFGSGGVNAAGTAFNSFGSNAVVLVGAAGAFDIDIYDNLLA